MKKILFFIALFLILSNGLFSQKHDFIWLSGYDGGRISIGNDTFGISIMNFNPDTTLHLINDQENEFKFNVASTMMCDSMGDLLFYSNGIEIWNHQHQLMENGDSLNEDNASIGYNLSQGVLALPFPGHDSLWAFIHGTWDFFYQEEELDAGTVFTWYSIINMNKRNGLGEVVLKMDTLSKDTLLLAYYTTCRHGNGRDWWIFLIESCPFSVCATSNIQQYLLKPDGIFKVRTLNAEGKILEGASVGQARFTPGGSKYIYTHSIGRGIPTTINVYDFDRCNGELSNYQRVELPRELGFEDAAFEMEISPNSRFVYLVRINRVEQFDLWAEDIKASKVVVAEYDGFVADFATLFYLPQLAPDGKIYINTPSTTRYLHVINRPNEKGLTCDLQQHSVLLPTLNGRSFPNHPNYRLYEAVDSPCDTIGRDTSVVSTVASTEVEKAIKIYPNPAFDVLHVALDVPQKVRIRLYNMQGQLVLKQSVGQQEQDLDIRHLPAGIYFCQIQTNDHKIYSEKIIISR